MAKDSRAFAAAHPELAERYRKEGLDWINKYTHSDSGKITEYWERNDRGVLVNVTEREKTREEIERAKEELERLRAGGKLYVPST